MDFSRFSLAGATLRVRRHRFSTALPSLVVPLLAGGVLLGTLSFADLASAQKSSAKAKKPAQLPLAPPIVVPTAPDIRILLLAIDDLPAPGSLAAVPAVPVVPNAATLAPVAPDAIVPTDPSQTDAITPVVPPAITPSFPPAITPSFGMAVPQPQWSAQAKKKPKVDKDANLFRPEPETGSTVGQKRRVDALMPAPGAMLPSPALPGTIAPAPATPLPATSLLGEELGRARLTAIPLRDALLALGWRDVALTAPSATLVTDAMSERRLTPRTLDSLKAALAELAAPGTIPSPDATRRASLAASRIGQSLGYRAVAVLHVALGTPQDGAQSAGFSLLVADSARENGEPILFDERGPSEVELRRAGASTAAALLDKALRAWPAVSPQNKLDLASTHLANARALLAAGDTENAQDELNQTIALDSSKSEPFGLLGDLLAPSDPTGAARAYARAVEIDPRDAATLAKIAVAYSGGTVPDWPRALESGRKAIAAGFDSVSLRIAMATAQFGRADLLRKAERLERADDAETDARKHLDRALELAPDDPATVRLLARYLVQSRRFNEATQTLDRVAPRYPTDLEIQTQYARALGGQIGREEDAFVAYGRVWKLSGDKQVKVDALKYRTLGQGFDARLYNLGRSAVQLTTGVANATVPREDALIQLAKLKEDMSEAENAIDILIPPKSTSPESVAARQFAASLMNQSLERQQLFLETGQATARVQAFQLYSQAVAQLNAARNRD